MRACLRLLNVVAVQPRVQLFQAEGGRRTVQVNIAAHAAQARTGFARRQHVVRGHQNRDALVRQLAVQAGQRGLGGCIHARERLVQQQQGGVRRQDTRQKNPLALTTGKLRNGSILQVQNIGTLHRRKDLHPILLRRAAEEPNLTHAAGHHRILDGQRKIPLELVLLRHVTDVRTRTRGDSPSTRTCRRPGRIRPKMVLQQRGLTGTVGANQTRKLAALQGQGQILEDGAARVAGVQV